jgi:hypothetical protein
MQACHDNEWQRLWWLGSPTNKEAGIFSTFMTNFLKKKGITTVTESKVARTG